jgi:hypothetical protein
VRGGAAAGVDCDVATRRSGRRQSCCRFSRGGSSSSSSSSSVVVCSTFGRCLEAERAQWQVRVGHGEQIDESGHRPNAHQKHARRGALRRHVGEQCQELAPALPKPAHRGQLRAQVEQTSERGGGGAGGGGCDGGRASRAADRGRRGPSGDPAS